MHSTWIVAALSAIAPALAAPGWGDIDGWDCATGGQPLNQDTLGALATASNEYDFCSKPSKDQISEGEPLCAVVQPDGSGFCFNLEGGRAPSGSRTLNKVLQSFKDTCKTFNDGAVTYMLDGLGHHDGQVRAYSNVSMHPECGSPDFAGIADNQDSGPAHVNAHGWHVMKDGWKWYTYTNFKAAGTT